MSTGIIGISVTGMRAAQLGLLTTEHNITNANTLGYTRQRTIQASNMPLMTGAGAVGQGAHVQTIQRSYNQYLVDQVNASQTNVSELDAYYAQIKQIDNMLADPKSGLTPALQDFFKGVQEVAANPSLLPARQSMVSAAEALTNRFKGIESRLDQIAEGVNTEIGTMVSSINSYGRQIASLNQRIIQVESMGTHQANDLLDQRDQLVAEVNKLIRVSTTTNTDGSVNVFIGSGQQLVLGMDSFSLNAGGASADLTRTAVYLEDQELPESLLTGGQLGGIIRFRNESLDSAYNELGRVAASLALTFNAQHGLGQDLLGRSAGSSSFQADFFNVQSMQPRVVKGENPNGVSSSAAIQSSFAVAAAYTLSYDGANYTVRRQSDGTTWSGASLAGLVPDAEGVDLSNASVVAGQSIPVYSSAAGGNFFTNLTASDYRLSFDGTNYSLMRLSDSRQWNTPADAADLNGLSALVAASEGFTLSLTGTPQQGDNFLIQPTRNAARNIDVNRGIAADPRLIAAGMPFRISSDIANTGSGSISNSLMVSGDASTSVPAGVSFSYNSGNLTFSNLPAGAELWATAPGGTPARMPGATIPFAPGNTVKISFAGAGSAGISFQFSGNPADGDAFTISANTNGVEDGRNIVLLGKLQSQNTIAGGKASYQAAYAQFVSDTGTKTRETQVTGEAQQALLEQAQGAREAISGVNLDEEAANLLRYQQAYQAAARMLDIGSKLFDAILSIRS